MRPPTRYKEEEAVTHVTRLVGLKTRQPPHTCCHLHIGHITTTYCRNSSKEKNERQWNKNETDHKKDRKAGSSFVAAKLVLSLQYCLPFGAVKVKLFVATNVHVCSNKYGYEAARLVCMAAGGSDKGQDCNVDGRCARFVFMLFLS